MPTATEKPCSKCKKNPRADADGTNPWCKECRAEYQRDWQENLKEMRESRGYAAGCSAMKHHIAKRLRERPDVTLSSWATAEWVLEMGMPD